MVLLCTGHSVDILRLADEIDWNNLIKPDKTNTMY